VKAIVKYGDRIYIHIANFFSEAFFLGRPMGLRVREGEGGKYEKEDKETCQIVTTRNHWILDVERGLIRGLGLKMLLKEERAKSRTEQNRSYR